MKTLKIGAIMVVSIALVIAVTELATGATGGISGMILSGAQQFTEITVAAGGGLDTKTAGTLEIGVATANKVEIGDVGVETEIEGHLACESNAVFELDADVVGDLTAGTVAADNGSSTDVTMQSDLMTAVFHYVSGIYTGSTVTGP